MRLFGRIALRVIAGIIVVALACAIAAVMVFRSGWFHERVRERIIDEIQKASNARVDFGNFTFDWTRLTATAGPIVLHGREAANEAPLVSIRSVTIGLRVISMLERKVDLSSLRIEQPVVHIAFYPDGSTNIPPRPETDWVQDLLNVAIGRYEVNDGLIEYDDRKIPLNLRGENLRAAMSFDARRLSYAVELTSRRVRAMAAGYPPTEVDTSASFVISKSRIELKQLKIGTRQSRAELAGVLNDPRSPHGILAVKSTISIRDAAELFQLPVARTGSASFDGQLTVSLTDFSLSGRMNARGIGYARDRVKVDGAEARADVRITRDKLVLTGVAVKAEGATVSGSGEVDDWTRFHFDGRVADLTVHDAGRLFTDRQIPWNGTIAAGLRVEGILGQNASKVEAAVAITPAPEGAPGGASWIDGQIDLEYDQATSKLRLSGSRLSTAASRIEVSGTLGETLNVRAESTRLDDITTALAFAGLKEIPAKISFARATFSGNVIGALEDPKISGDVGLVNASVDGHAFDRFGGTIEADRSRVKIERAVLARGATEIQGSAEIAPPDRSGSISAQGQIRNADVAALSKEAGIDARISGTAAASVKFYGTVAQPEADVVLQLEKPAGFGEQLDRLRANLHYSATAIRVASGAAELGPGRVQFEGTFQHRSEDWKNGDLRFEIAVQNIAPKSIKAYSALETGVDGNIDAKATGAAHLANGELSLTAINAESKVRGVTWQGQSFGDVNLTANTQGNELAVHGSGQVRDIAVEAQGSWKLQGDYPGSAMVRISRADVASLHHVLMAGGPMEQTELPFEGFVDGATARVTVALRKPRDFDAEITIPAVQLNPRSTQTLRLGVQAEDLVVKNSAPVVIALTAKEARIRSAPFTARDTTLEVSGSVPLAGGPSDLSVRGSVNLIILQLLNPDLIARGNATVQAGIRGTFRDPQLSGRMELKNASLYLSDFPNGVDNANGSVLFDRNRATIDKLRAETGGGTVDFSGFIGFGSPLVYRLQAVAQKVRVRYPEDVSVTFNATLALNGTSDASTVSGVVTFTRASFTPRADLAQIFAAASKPTPAPATSSEIIRGTQFDVRIESGPNFGLETSLTRNLEAEVDLRLRGTPLRPALLGTASVNEGEVQVFGNRYTVNRGDIRFLNPVRIDPIFDLDLETRARGVTVNIAISGTMQKLNVNYSSDPPMQPREIITLLAVGRAPTDTAGLNPEQSTVNSSSLAEAGGGLIGQAITAQLSSRFQRFFGASRVKIDPTVTGVDYLPQARLTIEQQVSKDITLTYITNLNRTQEQIVQVQYDFSKRWSAIAIREANGLFGIDFQYKKRFK
jgi:translocation and assembly module TamB